MSLRTWSSSDLRFAGFGGSLVTDVVPAARRCRWGGRVGPRAWGPAAAFVAIAFSAIASAQGTVTPPGISLSGPGGTSSSVTIKQGETATVVFEVTPSGGFTGIVTNTAAVTSIPAGCRLRPWVDFGSTSQVNITGTDPVTAILKIYGDGHTHLSSRQPQKGFLRYAHWGAALACIVLVVPCSRQRRWLQKLTVMAFLAALTGGLIACGNPGEVVTPGDYVITVTSFSGALYSTNTVNLTVQ
jgi:hypothetical protein